MSHEAKEIIEHKLDCGATVRYEFDEENAGHDIIFTEPVVISKSTAERIMRTKCFCECGLIEATIVHPIRCRLCGTMTSER